MELSRGRREMGECDVTRAKKQERRRESAPHVAGKQINPGSEGLLRLRSGGLGETLAREPSQRILGQKPE